MAVTCTLFISHTKRNNSFNIFSGFFSFFPSSNMVWGSLCIAETHIIAQSWTPRQHHHIPYDMRCIYTSWTLLSKCCITHKHSTTQVSLNQSQKQFTFNALGFIVLFSWEFVTFHFFLFKLFFSLQMGQDNLKDKSCHWTGHSDSDTDQKHYQVAPSLCLNSSQKRGHIIPKGRHPILVVFGLAAVWRIFCQIKGGEGEKAAFLQAPRSHPSSFLCYFIIFWPKNWNDTPTAGTAIHLPYHLCMNK